MAKNINPIKEMADIQGLSTYYYLFLRSKLCREFTIGLFCIHLKQKVLIMSNIADKVKQIIVDKLGVDESEITEASSFTNDLGADSLDTVELIMEFEKEFDIAIPDEEAEKIATVGNAVSYLEKAKA